MKKLTVCLLLALTIGITGCKNKTEKYQETMKEYATSYYEKYMKGVEGTKYEEITIDMLDKVKEDNKDYDLTKLKKCNKNSKIILEINKDKSIKDYKYELDCK